MWNRLILDILLVEIRKSVYFDYEEKEAFMNNLYQWQNYSMVKLKMDEIKNEIESIRLLHDASLSNPGWFERTAITVRNTLGKLGQSIRKEHLIHDHPSHATSSKHSA